MLKDQNMTETFASREFSLNNKNLILPKACLREEKAENGHGNHQIAYVLQIIYL